MTYELLGDRFIPRSAIWGDVPVLSSEGVPRPPLNRPAEWLTVHYTGNDVRYAGRDQIAELKHLQDVMAATKPWEYNFVFFHDGRVAEYAGFFRAAHSEDENDLALGCLFLNGIDEPLTDAQVDAFRRFRQDLRRDGDLVDVPRITPHKDMPDASTACPGAHILARWDDLVSGGVVVPSPDCRSPRTDPERGIGRARGAPVDQRAQVLALVPRRAPRGRQRQHDRRALRRGHPRHAIDAAARRHRCLFEAYGSRVPPIRQGNDRHRVMIRHRRRAHNGGTQPTP